MTFRNQPAKPGRCDVSTCGATASHDLRRHIKLIGVPGLVRHTCEQHSGYISKRHREEYRIVPKIS